MVTIGTNDILKIKVGSSLTAMMNDYGQCLSVKQLAYRAGILHKRKFSVKIDTKFNKVTVTAIS